MSNSINILEISKQTGVSAKKIKDILYFLSSKEFIENNELVRLAGISKNAINLIKQNLSNYLEPSSKYTKLNSKGLDEVKEIFNENYMAEESLFNFLESKISSKSVLYLKKIQKPPADRNYDQFYATEETVVKRAALINFLQDLDGKRVLLLGDDDFLSLILGKYKKASQITVLDIDKRLLDAIQKEADNQNFNIQTIEYDARKSLPEELVGKFDIVFTDPPYTTEGIQLFASRAIEALDKKNQCARIYVCYGNSDRAKERFLPIYEVFSNAGLMVRWIFDKFNRYNGAESIGSTSSLFICEITPKTKSIPRKYDKIYTFN